MLLTETNMIKMSEANIITQYSIYLQDVSVVSGQSLVDSNRIINQEHYLNYEEFKEYYILMLVGKSEYVERISSNLQNKVVSGVI